MGKSKKYDPPRSVRVSDELWERARRRAIFEGVNISQVVALLVEGYGNGQLDLPEVRKVYGKPL